MRCREVRKPLKWFGLVLCLLPLVPFAASWAWMIFYQGRGWGLRLDEGVVNIHWGYPTSGTSAVRGRQGWSVRPMDQRLGFRLLWPRTTTWPAGRAMADLPIWIFLGPAVTVTLALCRLDRKQFPHGHCAKCGYYRKVSRIGAHPDALRVGMTTSGCQSGVQHPLVGHDLDLATTLQVYCKLLPVI